MTELEIANNLVNYYFKDKKDKGGHPYIEHLYYVSSKGRNEMEQIIGLLHDILEDTKITPTNILESGISKEIVEAIYLLTKDENMPYSDYITNLIYSGNESVLYIKKVDMEHNMDLSRIVPITEKDIKRNEQKYKPNYERICIALKELEQKKLIKSA